jgi:hypothetical protein
MEATSKICCRYLVLIRDPEAPVVGAYGTGATSGNNMVGAGTAQGKGVARQSSY